MITRRTDAADSSEHRRAVREVGVRHREVDRIERQLQDARRELARAETYLQDVKNLIYPRPERRAARAGR